MTLSIAINGFGRIGRLTLRAALESKRDDITIVAINDLGVVSTNAHLLRYDSVHGTLNVPVTHDGNSLSVGNQTIQVFREPKPGNLPWADLGVDIVFECTGRFTSRDGAAAHLKAGAKKVLISAPGKNADYTTVYGVNHTGIQPSHQVISNASCTTNCLAPIAKVAHEGVGILRGYTTTIHSYTGDQPSVDSLHSDLRRARASAISMIPTSTGAARAVGLVLPELAGKLDGSSVRVPTPNVSIVDLVFDAGRKTSADEINNLLRKAADGALKGVLSVTDEPLVSSDFNHGLASSFADLLETQVVDDTLVRILSWYDNEWGFSNRMLDVATHIGSL